MSGGRVASGKRAVRVGKEWDVRGKTRDLYDMTKKKLSNL